MNRLLWGAAFLAAGLAACSAPGPGGPGGERPGETIVFSPNAEPLSGGGQPPHRCEAALEAWAARLAPAGGGTISRDAFLADARVQFSRMDADRDGFITADELSAYRAPFRPADPPHPVRFPQAEPDDDGTLSGRVVFPGGGLGGRGGLRRPDRPASATGADPVMSADANLDFKVSLDEFLHQADLIFDSLDRDRDGVLDPAEVRRFCPLPSR